MTTSLIRFVVVAEVEAVAVTAVMAVAADTVQLKDVRVTSAGAVRKNVKKMVVKAAKAAMEEKAERGKDINGLEMLGTLLAEKKAEKAVRKVKKEKDVEQEKVETVDLEEEEVSSAAMVLKVIMDRAEKTVESRKVIAVSEETVTEDQARMAAVAAVLATLPPVTLVDLI